MLSSMQLEECMFTPLNFVREQKESTYAKEIIMIDNLMTIMIMIITIMFITKVAILILNK